MLIIKLSKTNKTIVNAKLYHNLTKTVNKEPRNFSLTQTVQKMTSN